MYEIIDRHMGKVVGHASILKRARRSVDRRDFFARKVGSDAVAL